MFGVANVIIITAWLSHPEDLPRSYKKWIDSGSRVPLPYRDAYAASTHGNGVDPWKMSLLFPGGQMPEPISEDPVVFNPSAPTKHNPYGTHPAVLKGLYRWMQHGDPDHIPCGMSHPHAPNHLYTTVENFFFSWKWIMCVLC